ncbi:MAG: AMP-dependent synthetase/ligase [Planctomycetota bacterium]
MSQAASRRIVADILRDRAAATPHAVACHRDSARGAHPPVTWSELHDDVTRTARRLRRQGLTDGARVAIIGPTSYEWHVLEMATLKARGVVVGLDPYASTEVATHVLRHSECRWLVALSLSQAEPLVAAYPSQLERVATFDEILGSSVGPATNTSRQVLDECTEPLPAAMSEDMATIIYTSGTSGPPKGLAITHRQLVAACESICNAFPEVDETDKVLCWLPMSHLFQRMLNLVAIERGACMHFVEDPASVVARAREARPTVLVGVPRFFERLALGIRAEVRQLPPPARKIAEISIRWGREYARAIEERRSPSITLRWRKRLADALVLRRIRSVLGGRIRFMISGSAPLRKEILESLHAVGLLVLEAYGLSENTIPMSINRLSDFRFGSVGRPLPENELRFCSDGEICVRSDGLFQGYYRETNLGGEFDQDGFYRTGDIGSLDNDGFLHLRGRKKEIIKTSTGRRISPAQVEAVYAQSPLIEQIVVVGDGRKCLVALLRAQEAAADRSPAAAAAGGNGDAISLPPKANLRRAIESELERLGQSLTQHERVAHFAFLPEPLSVAGGELTPTLKLRRNVITEKYASRIDRLYEELETREKCVTSQSRAEVSVR